jgi:hypothetical protein
VRNDQRLPGTARRPLGASSLLIVAVLLAAGCGGSGSTGPPSPGAGPREAPPRVPGVRSAPPPAWISTRGGSYWLAFGGYCWSTTCVDPRPAEQRTDIPEIELRRDELVRFHLRFEPSEVTLRVDAEEYPLAAQQAPDWRVEGRGGLSQLTARGKLGSAGYLARFRVR